MTIQTIIAAIALENGEQPVARRALQLAAEHGAKVILVHAIESLPACDPDLPSPANAGALCEVIRAEAIESLQQMATVAAVATEIMVECGKADQLIQRLIKDHAADLLVIGPGKPQNLREKIFGSTADRVVRAGLCPVLVVKRPTDAPYQRVIAAVDFSPMSFAAAGSAARLAPGSALELVHVLEIPLTFEQAMLKVGTSQGEIDRYRKAKAQAAQAELRALRNDLAVPGTVRVVGGDPAIALVRLARSAKTDLVALGIQGRNAVAKSVLGSIARRVLAGSACDVLLTRDQALPV